MDKPRLSFWQIWNMSFGFFGIQFGWGLQMANMSSIYQYLGAKEDEIAWLWIAAPLTGLIVQPLVGYYSDRTWCGLGRRRPYFLVGAILSSLALIAMPNSSALWMAAGLLWVLDASINITMEPFRAFVGDLLPKEQRKSGFAMQSLLIGLGAVLSSALPFVLTNGFNISREASVNSPIPPAVRLAFFMGAGVFIAAVLYTILNTREYPPEDLAAFQRHKAESAGLGHAFREIFQGIGTMPRPMRQLAIVQFFTWFALFCMWIYFTPAVGKGVFGGTPLGVQDAAVLARFETPAGRPYLAAAAALARAYEAKKAELEAGARRGAAPRAWPTTLLQMLGLKPADPDAGERIDQTTLAGLITASVGAKGEASEQEAGSPLIQNFAAVLMNHEVAARGAAAAVAAAAELQRDLASARRYQEGAAWGGVCFSTYNLTAFGFSFALLALAKTLPARGIHFVCLLCGGVGLASTLVVRQPALLLLSMVGVGVAWASILSMPYAMLANAIPAAKMGFYMGVFNFFIVLPQILASAGLGLVMKHLLGDQPMNAVLLGGGSMVLAALCVGLVSKDVDSAGKPEVA
jgi:maltose/moltooligosaccharide transporter